MPLPARGPWQGSLLFCESENLPSRLRPAFVGERPSNDFGVEVFGTRYATGFFSRKNFTNSDNLANLLKIATLEFSE